MLRSQGWEPGQYLGPQDAAHAVYHTSASASHIKVALKEDNLGLGARMNRGDECTGLNAFKEMLARLNGKSEALIEQEKKARQAHAMNVYVERKFGTMRFVSGGFLVGDVIRDTNEAKAESSDTTTEPIDIGPSKEKKEKREKKRKVEPETADEVPSSKEERRRAKKQKNSAKEPESRGDGESGEESKSKSKSDDKKKKEKKRRKEESVPGGQDSDDEESREKRRKREKKERKERRREKRDKKLKKKQNREEEDSSSESDSDEDTTAPNTGASTPTGSGISTPVSTVSLRHLARKRFIAQKRMAMKDQQALNQVRRHATRSPYIMGVKLTPGQIFMIKSS